MEICSTAEMFTSKSTRIVNIEGTSTVPWSTVQSAHTLHQQRLLPPSEKVEMLQVSIGLQATHMSARELLYCRTSSSAPRLRMPSLIALGLSMNTGKAVATGKAVPTSTMAIATILE